MERGPSGCVARKDAGTGRLGQRRSDEQAAVLEDFIQQLVLLHSLDPNSLGLDHMPIPTTSAQCALGEIDFVEQFLGGMVTDPLYTFSLQWIRNHVPEPLDRVSLLQGDTGPANFMFHEGQVSAVVDWEWAHFGDPMEDFGNICTREFYCPCTPEEGLAPIIRRYEELSGFPVHLDSVRYYRVPAVCAVHRVAGPHHRDQRPPDAQRHELGLPLHLRAGHL